MRWTISLGVFLTVVLGIFPATTQAQDGGVDCDNAYVETFVTWMAYLTGGVGSTSPARSDSSDPCLVEKLQAQSDAFAAWQAQQSAPALAPAPEPPQQPAIQQAPPAAGPPAPARTDGLVGQSLTACGLARVPLALTVTAAEERSGYIVLFVEAANLGSRSADVFRTFNLVDQRGRRFDASGSEGPYFDILRPLRLQGVISDVTNIQPGLTATVLMTFQVAPDSVSFRLAPDPLHRC